MVCAEGILDISSWTDNKNIIREKARLKADTLLRIAPNRDPAKDAEPDDSATEDIEGAFHLDEVIGAHPTLLGS